MVSLNQSKEEMNMYAVLEHGIRTFFGTYEECCDYLDNVALGWDSCRGSLFDVGIIPYDEED